jgi:hypothetical protein
MTVHLKGENMFFFREQNPEFNKKELFSTKCGYWFDKQEEETKRMTYDFDKVTCKKCLKLFNNK